MPCHDNRQGQVMGKGAGLWRQESRRGHRSTGRAGPIRTQGREERLKNLAGMGNNKLIRAARLMFSRPTRALAVQSIPCAGWMMREGWPCR